MTIEVQIVTNSIEVTPTTLTTEVEVTQYNVDITFEPLVVEIAEAGTPGPKGDKGDPGEVTTSQLTAALATKLDITKNHYLHTQNTLSTTWTINHNLGRKPQVEIRDLSGQPIGWSDVVHNSDNVAVAVFTVAISGTAYCT